MSEQPSFITSTPVGEAPQRALPKIEYSEDLGSVVKDISVDAACYADFMKAQGMSEEDIADTTIRITGALNPRGLSKSKRRSQQGSNDGQIFGSHEPSTRTVEINVLGIKLEIDRVSRELEAGGESPFDAAAKSYLGSLYASRAGFHELTHRVERVITPDAEEEHFAAITPEGLAGRAIRRVLRMSRNPKHHTRADNVRKLEVRHAILKAERDNYEGMPGEVQARTAADKAVDEYTAANGNLPIQLIYK